MPSDINAVDELGCTLLFIAVEENDLKQIRRLLSLGADPNIPEVNGVTPLMEAASGESEEILRLLLEAGANLYRLDNFGDSVLDYACDDTIARLLTSLVDPKRMASAREEFDYQQEQRRREIAEILKAWPQKRSLELWTASIDGERYAAALSRSDLESKLDPEDLYLAEIDHQPVELPLVNGEIDNWGDEDNPAWHVSWNCPICKEWHDTDLPPDVPSRSTLDGCFHGYGELILICWHAPAQ